MEFIVSGGQLWVDATHWYYAVYHEPFEPVSKFILRHISEWQAACGRDGLVWASQSGSLPKMALPSLIFASSELMAARTLPLAQRLNIIRWVNHLWLGCAFSGVAPTSQAGSAVPIVSGAVDTKVRDRLKQQVWLCNECSYSRFAKISIQFPKPWNIFVLIEPREMYLFFFKVPLLCFGFPGASGASGRQ
jgi:hypothetical protein